MQKDAVKRLFTSLPELTLVIGILILILGGVNYYKNNKIESTASGELGLTSTNAALSLTERKLAIEQAIKEGKKEYSYTTNFIPGLGRVGDPDAYMKEWEKEAKKTLN